MQCLGVNDKTCNNWVNNPEFPNDNVCDSCWRKMEEAKPADKFAEGVRYALNYLADLYESIDETDIWADYMKEEAN